MRALVAGWFSFEDGHATAGNLLARDVVCEWLANAGMDHDVAVAFPFEGGVDWRLVPSSQYDVVCFVSGPFGKGRPERAFLRHFASCRLVGINLSMTEPLRTWNPFEILLERDSSAAARPDLAFLSRQPLSAVVGRCLVESYEGAECEQAHVALDRLLASQDAAVIDIDTRLDVNATGLRTAAQVQTLLARVDVVVTTRLHGLVLALKNAVPALVVDPERGGAQILRQAKTIGWPAVFSVDTMTDAALHAAYGTCLTEGAREKAAECGRVARALLQGLERELLEALAHPAPPAPRSLGATPSASGTIAAVPNPIPLSTDSQVGVTSLEWTATRATTVEVHVGSPDGPLLSRSGPAGSATTGPWVADGTTFYLQDAGEGVPLTSGHTLATVVVDVLLTDGGAQAPPTLTPPLGRVNLGDLGRLQPISRQFGFDRGRPVDRYYIERFLSRHSSDIRGRVLEIGDDTYTRRFGLDRVTHRDVLHVSPGHPGATIVADLAVADDVPSDTFDCVILTQTLQCIYDPRAALRTVHRILKHDGTLLATFPGISQLADVSHDWYWQFTRYSAARMFEETFPGADLEILTDGNVMVAVAFLHGLATEELRTHQLDFRDPDYQLLITVRAAKRAALIQSEDRR